MIILFQIPGQEIVLDYASARGVKLSNKVVLNKGGTQGICGKENDGRSVLSGKR
jgi:hypothetical protein